MSGEENTRAVPLSPQHGVATCFESFVVIDKDLSKLADKRPDLRKRHLLTCNISQRGLRVLGEKAVGTGAKAALSPRGGWGLHIKHPWRPAVRVCAPLAGGLSLTPSSAPAPRLSREGRTDLCVLSEGPTPKWPLLPSPRGGRGPEEGQLGCPSGPCVSAWSGVSESKSSMDNRSHRAALTRVEASHPPAPRGAWGAGSGQEWTSPTEAWAASPTRRRQQGSAWRRGETSARDRPGRQRGPPQPAVCSTHPLLLWCTQTWAK